MKSSKLGIAAVALALTCMAMSCTAELRENSNSESDNSQQENLKVDDIKVKAGQLKVKFSEGTEPQLSLLSSIGAKRMERVFPYAGKFEERTHKAGLDRWYKVWYDEDVPVTKAANSLEDVKGIEIVEKIYPVRNVDAGTPVRMSVMGKSRMWPYSFVGEPESGVGDAGKSAVAAQQSASSNPVNDPYLSDQWHYSNDGSFANSVAGADINLFKAWQITSGSNDVVVAVVDGGIDYTHEDLSGNVGNWAELYGKEGVDDDNNGYIDDIYGWQFVYSSKNPKGTNKITADDHGTHVAGTIGAENNNGKGVCGVAGGSGNHSGVRLLSCQIFTDDDDEEGDSDAAIKYAADAGAVICQNSWGYDGSKTMPASCKEAIDYFIANAGIDENGNQVGPMKGGIVIFAAGNDARNYLAYPACYDKVLSVSAIAPDYRRAYYSNFATWIDVAAPGGSFKYNGRYADECAVLSTLSNNEYGYMQGTSMACPHVSGVAALVVSKYGGQGFTPDKLWTYLVKGVKDIDSYNSGYKGLLGSGLIDAYKALSSDQGYAPDAVSDLEHSNTAGEVELTWSVPADKDDGCADRFIIMWRVGTLDNPDPDNLPQGAKSVTVSAEDKKAGDKMSYLLEDMDQNTKYTVAIIAVDTWGNRSSVSSISFGTPANEPPVISTESSGQIQVKYNETVRVTYLVTDPDSKVFTYELKDPSRAVSATWEDNKLHLDIFNYKKTAGSYALHLTVSDRFGASDSADLSFDLLPDQAPQVVSAFKPVYLGSSVDTVHFNPSSAFTDEIPEKMKFAVEYDRTMLLLLTVKDGYSIKPLKYGRSVVTVRATDEGGNSTTSSFAVLCRDDSRVVDLYPNPVKDVLNVRMGRDVMGTLHISVYDNAARELYSEDSPISPTDPASFDLSALGGGTYTVKLTYPGGSLVRNIVKL